MPSTTSFLEEFGGGSPTDLHRSALCQKLRLRYDCSSDVYTGIFPLAVEDLLVILLFVHSYRVVDVHVGFQGQVEMIREARG